MSNKQEKRANQILELLTRKTRMDVTDLAEALGVSQVTARKDLDGLEMKGFIRRIHGFAELNTSDHISSRLAYHYNEKRQIAEAAASMVQEGDTILIESGSCCTILAGLLAQKCSELTILTNSAFIAEYIRSYKNIQVVLLGGLYQHDSQCLVGPMIRDNVANYHVQYFFVGTDGWNERIGFTNKDPMRAQAVRDMSSSCEEVIILTESEKFQHTGTVPLNLKNRSLTVITDEKIPSDTAAILEQQHIRLQIIPAASNDAAK